MDEKRPAPEHPQVIDPFMTTAHGHADTLTKPLPASEAPVPGYILHEEVGHGGMGIVYRATDLALQREVAVKVLANRFPAQSPTAVRFQDEARITAGLQHPGIPPVYHVGEQVNGQPFLAMKLIKGETLDEKLKAGKAVDRLGVFAAIAQAVGYAHAHNVIHRDLKPANVMVGAFGEVQVMDWGLAKVLNARPTDGPGGDPDATGPQTEIRSSRERDSDTPFTQYGSALGTPAFMPPEQAAGELDKVDQRSDVFGLGAILCVLLTGKPPFEGATADEVRLNALRGKTDPALARLDASDAEPGVVALCKRCLAFNPADRPANAQAVAAEVAALRQAADERARQAEVERERAAVRETEARKRRRLRRTAGAGVLLVLLVGTVGTTLGLLEARRQRENENRARTEAEANFEKAVLAAEMVSEQLARGIKPIAGTQSKTVLDILARAEGVYDDLLAGPNPPARVRLNKAKMLTLAADVYLEMNRLDDSIERSRRAVELCQELIATNGDHRENHAQLGKALQRLAKALVFRGNATEGLQTYAESIRTLDAIDAAHATNPDETFTLAGALTLSGNVRKDQGDFRTARALYERGLQLREEVFARVPSLQSESQLGISCERYGLFLIDAGHQNEGFKHIRRGVQLLSHALESDPNNHEYARSLITALNSLAYQELTSDRAAAMEHLHQALKLAERFAQRDPDDNTWKREALRARWTVTSLERKHNWVRLTPEDRLQELRKSIELTEEILRAAAESMKLTSRSDTWVTDDANLTARLGDEYAGIAELVPERLANLKLAAGYYESSVAKYRSAIAHDPKSLEKRLGLLYALFQGMTVMEKITPDATAFRWYMVYVLEGLRTYYPIFQREPEFLLARTQIKRHLDFAGTIRIELLDTWRTSTAKDPALFDLLLDLCEAVPEPTAFTDPVFTLSAVQARGRLAFRLDQLAMVTPLSARGVAVRAKLRPTGAAHEALFDHTMGVEWYQEGQRLQAKRDYDGTIAAYRQTLKFLPNNDVILTALAWILATCPLEKHRDGKAAIELATLACERSAWKNASHIGTLAAAYAETGDFTKALEMQTKAIAFPESDPYIKARRRDRLELIQKKQAIRDMPPSSMVPPELQVSNFAAKFPGEPLRAFRTVRYGNVASTLCSELLYLNQVEYSAGSFHFPTRNLIATRQDNLDRAREGCLRTGQLLSDEFGEFGKEKYPMRDFTNVTHGFYYRYRIILTEKTMYVIAVVAPDQKELTSEATNTLFNSFTLDPATVTACNKERDAREARWQTQLDDFVAGRAKLETPAEALAVARYARVKFRYVDTIRLFEHAYAADPKVVDDMIAGHRVMAAISALLAARGEGLGAPTDPNERAALRRKALVWMQADLAALQQLAASTDRTKRTPAIHILHNLLRNDELSETTSAKAQRDGWTMEEVNAWDKFWADVQATFDTARKPLPTEHIR